MSFLGALLSGIKRVALGGSLVPFESTLNFVSLPAGSSVVDNPTAGTTDVTIAGSSGGTNYQTVQSGGSSQTQRAKLNFIGLQVADNSGNGSTDVTALTGWVNVTSGTPVTLSLTQRTAYTESFFGVPMFVVFPAIGGAIVAGVEFTVRDGGSAALYNVTVSAADSANIENPYDGSLSSTAVINTDKASITWVLDGSTWRIKGQHLADANGTWAIGLTSTGTTTATAEAISRQYWQLTGTLTGNATLVIPVPTNTTVPLEWIIDATAVTLSGHTLSLSMNTHVWGTTIGTTNLYRVFYGGSTGKLYGEALTP